MVATDVIVRRLTISDAEAFRAVRLRGLRESPLAFGESANEFSKRTLEEMARPFAAPSREGESFVLGAVEGAELLGVVGLTRNSKEKLRHIAVLWGMYVVPEARRRGIGQSLVRELIQRASTMPGLEQIILGVGTHNRAAAQLYESAGFKTFGIEPRAIKLGDEYVDEHHMICWLR